MSEYEFVQNAAGRTVPTTVNGKAQTPYQGLDGFDPSTSKAAPPIRSCRDYPPDGDKRVPDLKTALEKCGLRDGMTISSHHHLRNGDRVALKALEVAGEMGVKDLMWFPSASFPCHEPVIDLLDRGVVHHIEGSMNGPLGRYTSEGKMRGLGVLRSHGGRWQAIQDGDVHIDIAVIAAPTADSFGNANGSHGPSACGSLGFALADSIFADHVILVTDNLVPFPCIPWQIQGNNVDYVVEVDSIGDPSKIVSGTTQITKSPDRLLIAEHVARFVRDAGIMKDGFSFQAGAGGIALAFAQFLKEMMKEAGVKARFVRGGSTQYLVEMLEEGLVEYILDGQTFDLAAVESIASNPRHVAHLALHLLQLPRQGEFRLHGGRGGVGGHRGGRELQRECEYSFRWPPPSWHRGLAELPLQRVHHPGRPCRSGSHPRIGRRSHDADRSRRAHRRGCHRERNRHQSPPGRPAGSDEGVRSLPIRPIQEIKEEVEGIIGGKPQPPRFLDEPVAVIKWVDGTVLDTVWRVAD